MLIGCESTRSSSFGYHDSGTEGRSAVKKSSAETWQATNATIGNPPDPVRFTVEAEDSGAILARQLEPALRTLSFAVLPCYSLTVSWAA